MLKNIEEWLLANHYSNSGGFYTEYHDGSAPTEADKVWSGLAKENPIRAAAATTDPNPFAKYPEAVEKVIPESAGLVLDAGCGYGRVAIPILRKRSRLRLVGVDASPVMLSHFLDLLRKEADSKEMSQRLILVHSNLERQLFPANLFDCIFSCDVLLHNPYAEVQKIIREFHRLLKPQGILILSGSFPNLFNPEGIQAYLYLKCIAEGKRNGPIRVYTRRKIHTLFHSWGRIEIIPREVILFPRQIGKIALPFNTGIRRINDWVAVKDSAFIRRTSLLAKFLDVIAEK